MTSRKRKAEDDEDGSPAAKKPKIQSMYTRTDPITGKLGRIRKKDDKYWSDFTRRAQRRKEKRDARREREEEKKENDDAKKKKEREERRKKRASRKKKESKVYLSTSESESGSEEDGDIKRDDQTKFVPFHNLTKRFKDHVCVVTGGGRGIGKACALRLAQEGGIIYILDNVRWKETENAISDVQRELHDAKYKAAMAGYRAECHELSKSNKNKTKAQKPRKLRFKERVFHKKCDVTDAGQAQAAIDSIVGERGYIDVVLNCVNTTGRDYGCTHSHDLKAESFERIMRLNLYSTVNVCNAVIPYMKKESYGRIVNLANVDGKNGHAKCLAFSAAKAAVINVTKTLGQEYAGTGITVNCIAPQYDEYHTDKLGKEVYEKAGKVPMGRAIDMEELAGTVAFIASEENTYTTGFCYDLSGGTSTY